MIIKQLFSSAKYIIRLDDACHFSDLSKWKKIESILDRHNILPIVAVIPENKDKALNYSNFNINFWELVKSWEKKGWTIAMHGYNHLFHKVDRKKLIFPYYNRSEFAGLSINEQRQKIKNALKIFFKNKINPTVWISPAHCFDKLTLEAIKHETTIKIISDGISFSPYFYKELHFIPQQLWRLKKKLFGLWTICLHPDTMTNNEILDFEKKVSSLDIKNNIICLQDINLNKKGKSIIDLIFSLLFWMKYNLSIMFKKIIGADE